MHKRLLLIVAAVALLIGFPLAQTQRQRITGDLEVPSGGTGLGGAPRTDSRLFVKGATADSTTFALLVQDSVPTNLFYARNDGLLQLTKPGGIVNNYGRYNSALQQPGFLAFNVTSDGAVATGATIDFDGEVFDEAGNFAADTFTAPVTGRYSFCTAVQFSDASANATDVSLVTSNRTYLLSQAVVDAAAQTTLGNCVIADMDTSDTASIRITSTVVIDTVFGGTCCQASWFTGRLVP